MPLNLITWILQKLSAIKIKSAIIWSAISIDKPPEGRPLPVVLRAGRENTLYPANKMGVIVQVSCSRTRSWFLNKMARSGSVDFLVQPAMFQDRILIPFILVIEGLLIDRQLFPDGRSKTGES